MSSSEHDVVQIPRALFDRLVDTLVVNALRSEQILPSHMSSCPQS
jgi:hypothetical protein